MGLYKVQSVLRVTEAGNATAREGTERRQSFYTIAEQRWKTQSPHSAPWLRQRQGQIHTLKWMQKE